MTQDFHTYREIRQQPVVWRKAYEIIRSRKDEISAFLDANLDDSFSIVLTGAGTSAYIGDALEPALSRIRRGVRAIATTDIITDPGLYFDKDSHVLLVSFARSGNSPESVAAYKIVRRLCHEAIHLIITCNPNGRLALEADPEKDLVLVLPDGTNDRSLAMTSSYSSMLIACLLCKNIGRLDQESARLDTAIAFASAFLSDETEQKLACFTEKKITRAVFLGSGPRQAVACECHLKLQELTDGQIMCSFDSFLGLRHGPKAVINEETLVVYLLSDDPYTRTYELDLVDQVEKENRPAAQIVVSVAASGMTEGVDLEIDAPRPLEGDYKIVPDVLVGQILGYFFSLSKGLDPDHPSVRGTISRVVSGVRIYDY